MLERMDITGTDPARQSRMSKLRHTIGKGLRRSFKRLYVRPGHFYSPITDAVEVAKFWQQLAASPVPESLPGIPVSKAAMTEQWKLLLPFMKSNPFSAGKSAGLRYQFDNPPYSWGDGAILNAMLRLYKPRRIVEVGCGWSSACTLDTMETQVKNDCEITFVEPYPALLNSLIGTTTLKAHIIPSRVQDAPLPIFESLQAGDVLFIDSTHIMKTGSDVCFELFEILPRLNKGVIVHIHDMFWPFEYPRRWAVDDNRSWNEIYAIRVMLTETKRWKVLFFNDYFAKVASSQIATDFPDFLKNSGGALWLQRC
jgi:hypothetical protein